MKVFRKELYKKAKARTEEECVQLEWPLQCDGAVVSKTGAMYGRDGYEYSAGDAWCEEVTDLDCQSDVDAMKDWKIGTEHVIRKNGKDVRVVVCEFELGEDSCSECAADGACYGNVPCTPTERTLKGDVYYKEVKEHKPLVLNLFFSPERNMTFTEHDINPDVGFVTGKYYRFIGKESDIRVTLHHNMRNILEHKVLKCTNGSGRKANFEGIGDLNNDIMYRWMYDGDEKKEFSFWKEMRPFVTTEAPDIITFDEGCKFKDGSVTGLFVARESKEKPKMKVDENFTFKKKYIFGTTLHEPKVVKTHKAYANDGACEACGLIISKGSFVLTANETDCNKVTKKTHRLCASCTAKYIKAKSDTDEKQSYIEGFKDFVKTNDIKVGTRIRITKDFGKDEDAGTYGHKGAEGKCGTVYYVGHKYINVRMDESTDLWWAVPYYAMEVIKETAKEPTYAERQAQWVKDNNVKKGTKVRVTRTFTEDEDGCCCFAHNDLVGMTGVVSEDDGITPRNLGVDMSDGSIRAVPYFALEVIKEPTYRRFANAEEFAPYRDEWFRVKKGGGFERITFYDDTGVRGATSTFITYQRMLEAGERENGEPCGVKEEI